MELDVITQTVLLYAPAIVSIITMICTVIVSIKKVASSSEASVKEVKEMRAKNNELAQDMSALIQENTELKEVIKHVVNRLDHIAEVDDGSKQ